MPTLHCFLFMHNAQVCTKCRVTKPLGDFYLSLGKPRPDCKACAVDYQRKRRLTHKQNGTVPKKRKVSGCGFLLYIYKSLHTFQQVRSLLPLPVPTNDRPASYPFVKKSSSCSFDISYLPDAAKASPHVGKARDSALVAALYVEASLRHHLQRSNSNWEQLGVPSEVFDGDEIDIERALASMNTHAVGRLHVQAHLDHKVSLFGLLL